MVSNNRKPTKLKALEGNRGKRPLPENEPEPEVSYEGPPSHLDTYAQEFWIKYAAILRPLQLLTEADHVVFENLCKIYGRIRKIGDQINNEYDGSTVIRIEHVGQDGDVWYEIKTNPLIVNEAKYLQQFRHHASEFGLTPKGRTGLSFKPIDDSGESGIL